ncbi:glycohydrolase toxin TNT-related protein [Rouxiella sp. Mn2063]|uniref:glycohydrolase toxin TNT-related protein n=1 Tax=Rouxiella sp. Mn2063 TaxID=3395262 RepID=UPI003BDDC891
MAVGLAGGVAGNSSNAIGSGVVAGKVAVENNALNSQGEKQRQDAKWSLPYLEGKKKEDAKKLVAELDEKSRAFDVALGAACQNLSSAACNGMRQELASMAKSYEKQLDGQYIGNMRSVYQDGAKQVDAQMWQYATADAKAEREANVTRLAENWGVSRETADKLYTTMAGIHTAAAIGGAVYGMKGVQEPGAAPSKPVGNDAIKESATSGRSPAPAPGNLAGDEEAGVWSQYDKYRKDQYNWNWPEKLGFAEEPIKTILPVGTRLDRYGEPGGSFLAPKGTPYGERVLAPGAKAEKYYEHEVLKPLPVMQGKIAPAFGEPGGVFRYCPI